MVNEKPRELANRRGYTLVISMLLLITMSMIGVVAVNMAVQEARIARNFENSIVALTWAQAGVEVARQQILTAVDPAMTGFDCRDAASTHEYPDPSQGLEAQVTYCIELVKTELMGDSSGRMSGQEKARGVRSYYYKVDSYVMRTDTSYPVRVRHVQTIEQQSRYSI